ncbi:hypothetical protein [Actinomadura keratinilytica]|uniref:hypothetical protein n=1 Tax=Actinomadura keratinilytica TaxID=547461 RepID=UPI0036224F4B
MLPPILVHRRTMRVVDGMHRLRAARLQGRCEIGVRFVDGPDADVFVAAVRANIGHGLPLSLADREAAAARCRRTWRNTWQRRSYRYRYEDMTRDLRIVDGAPLCGLIVDVMGYGYPTRFGDAAVTVCNLTQGATEDRRIAVYDRSAQAPIQIDVDVDRDRNEPSAAAGLSRRFRLVLDWLAAADPDRAARGGADVGGRPALRPMRASR